MIDANCLFSFGHHGQSRVIASVSNTIAETHIPSLQPQNEYIEEHIKRHGRRLDYFERKCVCETLTSYPVSETVVFSGGNARLVPLIIHLRSHKRLLA